MISAHADILIGRPVPAVWDFVVLNFFENYPRWSPEVEHLERFGAGPIALGSAARQVRVDRGRRTETTFRVVALEPCRCLEFREIEGRYRICYWLEPGGRNRAAPGTRLGFEVAVKRPGLVLRPLEPLIRTAVEEGALSVVRTIRDLTEAEIP